MIIPAATKRLMLIAPSWIGDTVMASVIYRAARQSCTGAEITIAARKNLRPLLDGNPWFDHVVNADARGMLGPFRTGRALAASAPEAVILLPGSFRSALMARCTGAPCRVGTGRDGRRRLLTHCLAHPARTTPTSAVEHYQRIAAACFGEEAAINASVSLHITAADEAEADRVLGTDQRRPLLLVPGANREDKRWPAECFVSVARTLARTHDLRPVITGAPGEAELTASIAAELPADAIDGPAMNLGLGGLKAVARRAALAISNDTGPRHVAAAVGTPLISLFGPTDHRWTTLADAGEIQLLGDPFLPEEEMADKHPVRCAIDRITATDVLSAARTLLDGQQTASS